MGTIKTRKDFEPDPRTPAEICPDDPRKRTQLEWAFKLDEEALKFSDACVQILVNDYGACEGGIDYSLPFHHRTGELILNRTVMTPKQWCQWAVNTFVPEVLGLQIVTEIQAAIRAYQELIANAKPKDGANVRRDHFEREARKARIAIYRGLVDQFGLHAVKVNRKLFRRLADEHLEIVRLQIDDEGGWDETNQS